MRGRREIGLVHGPDNPAACAGTCTCNLHCHCAWRRRRVRTCTAPQAFMVFLGWVVVPLYTVLTTTCVRNPKVLYERIKRNKKATEEAEGGMAG